MSDNKILTTADPKLREKSEEIKQINSDINHLVSTMLQVVEKVGHKGLGGLSAIQIGIPKRVFVLKLKDKEHIVINPRVKRRFKGKVKSWEMCFSVPGKVGRVKRYRKAEIEYRNLDGVKIIKTYSGLLARMFLHEIDHLNGILYIDKVEDKKNDMMDEKNYWKMRKTD